MNPIKKVINSIKDFIDGQRRYSFDKKNLVYREERMISRTTIILFFSVLFLLFVITLLKEVTETHKANAQKHYETVQELRAEISDKKYIEDELNLYTEIGQAVIEKDCGERNKENICEYIDYLAEMGIIWYPEVFKSACQIESGFGSSDVAKKYNNLFGMDHPTKRKTLSMYKSGGRFATFKNWKCSVLDRALWDYATFKTIPTKEEYYEKINTKYNTENPEYKNKLAKVAKNFSK